METDRKKTKSPKRRRAKKTRRWRKPVIVALAVTAALFLIVVNVAISMSDISALKDASPHPTVIYDREGRVASEISTSKKEAVGIKRVPTHLVQAVVAMEDQRFYHHSGIDYVGTLRALIHNLSAGKTVQGGSTITQQLAKNVFLTHDRTYKRKIKEMLLAKKIEREYSKNEIMEMYLNNIYFGEGAWGIKRAAEIYFGKEVDRLTLGESALLAGMIKAPSVLNPFKDFQKTMKRRDLVLDRMVELGFITEKEKKAAMGQEIVLEGKRLDNDARRFPHYVDYILEEAVSRYGLTANEVLNGGLQIHTELDPKMQEAVESVYKNDDLFPADGKDQIVQSGAVLIDPSTGGIRALVGGRGKHTFRGFNRASQLKRQPGSTMKPLAVYTPALESGYDLDSRLLDKPTNFGDYRPKNHDGRYRGEVTMYEAVVDSLNVPAVWLLDQIGVDRGMETVRRFGIPLDEKERQLGLALGGLNGGTSPLQLAQAYSAFANRGVMVEAHAIRRIEKPDGELVAQWYKKSVRVTSEEVAQKITYMLKGVVDEGTGTAARIPGRPIAGKTGTTQLPGGGDGAKDNWFVGYTPQLVGAVWLGYDKTDGNHYLTTTGGQTAARIFREMMAASLKGEPVQSFDLSMIPWKTPPKVKRETERREEKRREEIGEKWQKELEKRRKELEKEIKKRQKEWEKRLEEWRKRWGGG
ncbi:penicillin-binding protein 2A [Planifilum fimeticola]|jgi:penicillin-binding protein 2A|uniref:Penicillin-binding protein 2A n=1 Tax=Planifilum fimeticola TaxID=201975 RepID=A0A2T0LJ27_9BACL|nr:PBP1A family penicillin-binding protein [Planifilum fimeticola]PRX42523.1 penicillin-binding protein 2A [Planifilum fimeticola]